MPHASTFTRTSPGPGSGMSRSTSSQSPPALLICAAFIFVLITAPYFVTSLCNRQNVSVCGSNNIHKRSAQPSGDLDDFSSDPSAIRRRQKSRDRRNILRLSEATERCLCNHLFLKVAARESQCLRAFSLDSAWIDRVHANLLRSKFLGQYPRNRTHSTFGRRIDYAGRRRHRSYG